MHESSRFSPYELMFGRKAILPVDLEFDDREAGGLVSDQAYSFDIFVVAIVNSFR